MKSRFFSFTLSLMIWGACLGSLSLSSHAQMKPPPPDPNALLNFNYQHGRQDDTLNLIDQQNREAAAGDRSARTQLDQMAIGRDRAQTMVNMIKDEEMQKAMERVSVKGKQILAENPSIKSPLGIIAGAASLWYGRTLRLIKGDDVKVWTRLEMRGRAGEFWMESPLLNGKLRFTGAGEMRITVNRSISSIGSQAEMNYNLQDQSFNTYLRQPLHLIPNLDLTFGASRAPSSGPADGRAAVEYHLDF